MSTVTIAVALSALTFALAFALTLALLTAMNLVGLSSLQLSQEAFSTLE
jgi:hypothetical protein